MDFGPFGLSEVLFIALLALVLFGPRRLPELARGAGRVMTALRRATEELKRNFQDELDAADEAGRELRDAARELKSAGEELRDTGRSTLEEGLREARRAVAGLADAPADAPASPDGEAPQGAGAAPAGPPAPRAGDGPGAGDGAGELDGGQRGT